MMVTLHLNYYCHYLQVQIHSLEARKRRNLSLGCQVIPGWKEKECFMLCIVRKKVKGDGGSSTTTDMLKQKHTS